MLRFPLAALLLLSSRFGAGLGAPSASLPALKGADEYSKLLEEPLFQGRFRSLVRRSVRMPSNATAHFEVLLQPAASVIVFVWDNRTRSATLIQEFHPGPERLLLGTVAGMFETGKHTSALECAQFELEEEAHLRSDRWISLLQDAETVVPFDKYSNNRFHPFLALDCEPVAFPRALDAEEHIVIHTGVTHAQLLRLISEGRVNVLSSYTILLGLRKVVELGMRLDFEE